MKVLIVHDDFRKGGIERQILELLRGLQDEPDLTVDVLIMGGEMTYPEVYELANEVIILERWVKKDPFMFFRILNFLRKHRPDVIHSWGNMASVYLSPVVRILGIPFVNGLIRDAPKWKSPYQSKLLRAKFTYPFSDLVLGNSQAGLDSFGAPPSKSRVVLNGINLDRARNLEAPEEIRARFDIRTKRVIGMVGGFNYRKDYATFLKAAQLVLDQRKDVTFFPVGGGEDLEPLRQSTPSQYKSHILFPGAQHDVESIVNVFDIGVLATNAEVHLEGISNSIMEYMMLGKPVVATDGGGTPEIVQDGKTGFIVPPYAAEAMAEKLLYLLDHPEQAQEMGLSGRKRIEEEFALEKMVQTYLEIYRQYTLIAPRAVSKSIW